MSEVKITTDGKGRNLLYGYELPKKQRKEFSYLEDEEFGSHSFVKYRGYYYDVSEFMRVEGNSELRKWDGYHADSYFSGVVITISKDGEKYKIGRFTS